MAQKGPTTKDLLYKLLVKVENIERFQEKAEKKFEQIDKKFEQIDKKFDQIDARFEKIESRLMTIDRSIKNIDQFIKREADIIEGELNQAMLRHLNKEFPGYTIERYNDKLKTIRHHRTGKLLTDFDGLYLMRSKPMGSSDVRHFVIIEAKRYTTNDKVDAKLEQQRVLQEMVDIARAGDFSGTTSKFKNTALAHKFNKMSKVYLYIGGPTWEMGSFDKVEKIVIHDRAENIGYIRPSGSRYTIKDNLSYLVEGGGRKASSFWIPSV